MAKKKTIAQIKADYRSGRTSYSQLMANVLADNSRRVAAAVANISDDHYKKAISKKTGKIVLPRIEELIPRKSMILNKTVQDGRLITNTLKESLIKDLRDSLTENRSTISSGKHAGRVNPKLVDAFKEKITETFSNYVEDNPRLEMPANIHTIAVGEVRSTVNQTKDNYTKEFVKQNPQFTMAKRWLHNPKLSRKPRPHHAEAEVEYKDGIPVNENFVLSTGVSLRYPHDPKAPIEEVAGCNCDVEYFFIEKDEEEQAQTGMWFLDSISKNLQALVVAKAAAKPGEKRQRKDGVYQKQSDGSWLKMTENKKPQIDGHATDEPVAQTKQKISINTAGISFNNQSPQSIKAFEDLTNQHSDFMQLSPEKRKELINLSGLPNIESMKDVVFIHTLSPNDKHAIVFMGTTKDGTEIRLNRTIDYTKKTVYNQNGFVNYRDPKKSGVGADYFAAQVDSMLASGGKIAKIEGYAAGEGNGDWHKSGEYIGYYAWFRMGANATVNKQYKAVIEGKLNRVVRKDKEISKEVKDLINNGNYNTVRDILSVPGGLDYWRKWGISLPYTFDATDSTGKAILENYLNSKHKKDKQQ